MKIRNLFLLLLLAALPVVGKVHQKPTRVDSIIAELANPVSDYVLVVSHRGDWRNYPENSLAAVKSAINMGVDMVEIDLAMTADSVLVVCHDRRIDRTTTGKGLISSLKYDSICNVRLRSGHGIATTHKMPAFKDVLELCKGKVMINIDKGFDYYDEAMKLARERDMVDQLLIKSKKPASEINAKFKAYPQNMHYMPIVAVETGNIASLAKNFIAEGLTVPAYELVWSSPSADLKKSIADVKSSHAKVWVNTLWPSLCGGLCDDEAFEGNPAEIYGKLLDMGATIIQTDRPELLIKYLRSVNRHK